MLHPWYPRGQVRDSLRRLLQGYFIHVNRISGEYHLHPLDRDYAYNNIPTSPSQTNLPNSYHLQNLESRAASFYSEIRKPKSYWYSIEDLSPQLAEFEHLVQANDYLNACKLLNEIDYDYLYLWGFYNLILGMRERLLENLTDSKLEASNLSSIGLIYYSFGNLNLAIGYCEKALALAETTDDRKLESNCLSRLGNVYRASGKVEKAITAYSKSLKMVREEGDEKGEEWQLSVLANMYRLTGQIEKATQLYEESLSIAQKIGDRQGEGIRLGHLGLVYRALNQLDKSVDSFETALHIANEIGDRRGQEIRLNGLADAYIAMGVFDTAISLNEEAVAIAREIQHKSGESYALLGLAKAYLGKKDFPKAYRYSFQARDLKVPETSFLAALMLGIILLNQNDIGAGDAFEDAINRCQTLLNQSENLYEPRFKLATALAGKAMHSLKWQSQEEQKKLLSSSIEEYHQALATCKAPGVINETIRDLSLIRMAGDDSIDSLLSLLKQSL